MELGKTVGSPQLIARGEVIDGRFRVEQVLGSGGMGQVVSALHVQLGTKVAIKVLHPSVAAHGNSVERFKREAQTAASLRSQHIAKATDYGTLPSGAPYLVMEFLEGKAVDELSGEAKALGKPMKLGVVVDLIVQACDAIAEAHASGIVHRDLKPANLFVTTARGGENLLKVLDFGISKLIPQDGSPRELTQSHNLLGTPLYMAPEQLRSSKLVSPRTDIWALGVILYELLTTEPPFDAEEFGELFMKIQNDEPASLTSKRPDVPAEVAAVVMRCLEKKAEARPQTVAELAEALAPFGSDSSRRLVQSMPRLVVAERPSSLRVEVPIIERDQAHVDAVEKTTTFNPLSTRKSTPAPPPPPSKKTVTVIAAGVVAVLSLGFVAARLQSPVEGGPAASAPQPLASPPPQASPASSSQTASPPAPAPPSASATTSAPATSPSTQASAAPTASAPQGAPQAPRLPTNKPQQNTGNAPSIY